MSSAEIEGVPGGKPGDILCGKYRVDRVLGAGGMGVVVAATHMHLDEKVAIKFLLPDAAKSKDTVSRFDREAKAAVKIKSEHVARVSDVGHLENGSPFMVMEYLHGQDLAETIAKQGKLPIAAAVEYVLQACEALAEAHSLGIVHRDLKPANLFLTQRADGSACIKVLDFGISKVLNSVSMPGMTRTTAVMGSPLYMSPEQMKSSKDVDHRTDIWSLGAILYELLSGDPPFIADTMPQLCLMIMQEPPAPLASFRQDVPPQLEMVVRKCQEKNPDHRFQNVAELAASLAPFVTGRARLSAERVADVLRTSMSRGGSASLVPAMPAPPAGMPVPPTQMGAPYGVSSPSVPYGAGPGYVAQAQTGGQLGAQTSGQFGAHTGAPYGPPGAAATVMGAPHMPGMGATVHAHHGPPMAASTASSWEGAMGGTKKKSSAGLLLGLLIGVAAFVVIGGAVLALSGSKDGSAANNTLPPPSTATEVKPAITAPVVVPTETPVVSGSVTSEPIPSATAPASPGQKPGKITAKPGASASATASTKPTSAPVTTAKPSQPGLDDDRK